MAQDELFRGEMLDAQRSRWLGSVRLVTPVSHQIWALSALVIAATASCWLYFGHYTRRQRVSGQLVPSAGLLRVQSPTTGTVTRVYVHEGDVVHRGDALVEISGERDSAAMGPTQALIGTQLRAQAGRLHAQLTDHQQLVKQQMASLQAKLGMLQQQAIQIDDQIGLEQNQVASARDMLDKLLPLRKKGYVSAWQVMQQQADLLQTQSQIKALHRQRLDTRQQIEQSRQALAQLPLDLAAKTRTIQQEQSQTRQQLAQNELQRDAVLRAPADGVVSTLLIKPGQAITTEQPLLSVLPKDSVLQAELLVPSSAIGFVRDGTKVVLHYQAFPYQKFGVQRGTVVDVSRSALSPSEVFTLLGRQAPAEPLYQVKVAVSTQTVQAYGKRVPLMPGMAMDADLLLDHRRVIEWVFEPLYGMARRDNGAG